MSTTTKTRTAARKPDRENVLKARELAAKKATPRIAGVLTSGRKIAVAKLVELVALDAAEQGMTELGDGEVGKLGDPVVEHGLLAGYTAARYGKGRWVGKATGRAARKHFAAARKAS